MITAFLSIAGLSFVYFISAIPAGVALGLSPAIAAVAAGLGYASGSWLVVLIGTPLQLWAKKRVRLLHEPRDETKLFWKIWTRFGLVGLGFIAPVSCGPQIGSLVALAFGEKSTHVAFWFTVGIIPYCIGFALVAAFGKHLITG